MTTTTNISDNNSSEPLSPVQGGTGLNACTTGDILYASTTNTFARLPIGSLNNVLRVNSSLPVWNGTSSPLYTTSSSSTSISATVCTGNVLTGGSLQTVTLPTTFAVGAQVGIQGQGSGGWSFKAGTGTTIQYGSTSTSSGGALASSNQYDNCTVIGIVANTTWSVLSSLSSGLVVS